MVVKKNNDDGLPSANNPASPTQPEKNHENNQKPLAGNDKNSEKKIEITNSAVENKTNNPNDDKTLVINLNEVKRIILRADGNLEIEFNGTPNNQVITEEQMNNSQELQKIKNYCQQNGKDSLNQQELNSILNSSSTNLGLKDKPANNNYALVTGLSVAAALMVGLAIGLLLKRKKNIKRK